MFCGNCVFEIKDGAKFCPKCGNKVIQATVQSMSDEKPVADETRVETPKKGSVKGLSSWLLLWSGFRRVYFYWTKAIWWKYED